MNRITTVAILDAVVTQDVLAHGVPVDATSAELYAHRRPDVVVIATAHESMPTTVEFPAFMVHSAWAAGMRGTSVWGPEASLLARYAGWVLPSEAGIPWLGGGTVHVTNLEADLIASGVKREFKSAQATAVLGSAV